MCDIDNKYLIDNKNLNDINKYKEKFTCPITLQIFCNPVLAEDGYFYEESAITQLIKNDKIISPMTRSTMDKKMYKSVNFIDELNDFLQKYPELKNEQFKEDFNPIVLYKYAETIVNDLKFNLSFFISFP